MALEKTVPEGGKSDQCYQGLGEGRRLSRRDMRDHGWVMGISSFLIVVVITQLYGIYTYRRRLSYIEIIPFLKNKAFGLFQAQPTVFVLRALVVHAGALGTAQEADQPRPDPTPIPFTLL